MTPESPGPKTGRPTVVEIPNIAGAIMTKDVVSALVGTRVRDVAILLLEKRISAVPVLAADQQLVGMVSEGDLIGRNVADRVARRDWWLALLKNGQPLAEFIEALVARSVEQVMHAPVITIEARAPLHEIAEMLRVYDIKRLPVMRGGSHRGDRQPLRLGARHGDHDSAAGNGSIRWRLGRHDRGHDESGETARGVSVGALLRSAVRRPARHHGRSVPHARGSLEAS